MGDKIKELSIHNYHLRQHPSCSLDHTAKHRVGHGNFMPVIISFFTLLQKTRRRNFDAAMLFFFLQVDEYKAHVKLMAVRNNVYNLQAAQRSYFSASQVAYQIQMMSFGQRLLFEGRLHQELSTMLLEYGSIHSAFGWSKRALQVWKHPFFNFFFI